MTTQRALAILLTGATLSLTTASPARAEEAAASPAPTEEAAASPAPTEEAAAPSPGPRVLVWSSDSPDRRDPILGLGPARPATYLTPTAKPNLLLTPSPQPILSSGERTIIIVAAAIVGVVLIVAIAGAS